MKKIVNKNNNILELGEYEAIDRTLNYLINDLNIAPRNIEKCPSILYRNVDAIKTNYNFLKQTNIYDQSIETTLHILTAEPYRLKETYNYVVDNYGLNILNSITSILRVPKERIIAIENLNLKLAKKSDCLLIAVGRNSVDEIKDMMDSQEFKTHPELFTSTTLAHAKIEDIKAMINSEEFKTHPELFTSQTLAHAKIEDIKAIINSEEFKNHPELFTSTTLAFAKIEDIKATINSEEFKTHPELFTSETLSHAKTEYIKAIINSEEFKTHPELFTSETLSRAKFEDIKAIINSEEFKNYPELFTSTTLAHGKLQEIIAIIHSEEFKSYPKLFTSEVLARAKFEEVKAIINSEEFKSYPKLFTSEVLAHGKLEEIKAIINSEEFKAHPELFSSQTLAHAKLADIRKILLLPYWEDERFKKLLSSTILAKSKSLLKKIPINISLARQYDIENYLNSGFLVFKSPSQNYALIRYILDNDEDLVIDGSLNAKISYQPIVLKKKFGIDLNELIAKYPLDENMLLESDGVSLK